MSQPRALYGGLLAHKGHAAPTPATTPRLPLFSVPARRSLGLRAVGAAETATAPPPERAAARSAASLPLKRVKMTLRLDQERHWQLRLLAALKGDSVQAILTGLIDDGLARNSNDLSACVCLQAIAGNAHQWQKGKEGEKKGGARFSTPIDGRTP